MTTDNIPPRWYMIARDGIAMLCASEQDAIAEAAKADQAWPNNAPHVAVQLAPMQSVLPADAEEAARYRWLRSRDVGTIKNGGVFAGLTPDNVVLNGTDLDEAIDAAMEMHHD